ncbi:MAG TPA: DUF3090 family protein [Actinomycetota bacterium]|nr:DUF3090 family protein [Actinomycetota bacterium]
MNGPPEVFTADYVGEPGRRAFYLQVRSGTEVLTYALEKQQVSLLAEKLQDLLLATDPEDTIRATPPARDPALALTEPVEARWRVSAIGLGYDDATGSMIVLLQPPPDPALADLDEDEPQLDPDAGDRYLLRRDQARAFVLHATAALAEGRPLCQLCGLPIDPEGHRCPASNGHHPLG